LPAADLRHATLHLTDLSGSNLNGANLNGAFLTGADLGAAFQRNADSPVALLVTTDISGADLGGAELSAANFNAAAIKGTNFTAAVAAATHFANVDLSVANGLETMRHDGPSTIGIDTIYKSRGKIPEAFLRGCGVPDEFIAYIGSMVGRPIEFYPASSATRPTTRNLPSASTLTCKPKACGAGLHPTT
jgi:Pentapeptide repeats (8 copies)